MTSTRSIKKEAKGCWTNALFYTQNSPIVGIVVTISPNLSLYKMVVFPAASRPTISILISFLPNRPLKRLAKAPMLISKIWNYREGRESKSGKKCEYFLYGSTALLIKRACSTAEVGVACKI